MTMTVIMPIDTKYAGTCGVTDYTMMLIKHLRDAGVTVLSAPISEIRGKYFKNCGEHIFHIQYPASDSRYSFLPHIYSHLQKRTVITFHETLTLNLLRRSTFPLFKFDGAIVTNDCDLTFITKAYSKKIIEKITLAPTFPPLQKQPRRGGRLKVCYFGLIRKDKNLDDVQRFASLIAEKRPDVDFSMVCGVPLSAQSGDISELRATFPKETIWHINTPTKSLAELLAEFDMAYLPYPNGADENRTSLISFFPLGVVPIIYVSERTPLRLRENCMVCDSPETALATVPLDRESLAVMAKKCAAIADAHSWDNIVKMHTDLYLKILRMTYSP